MTKGEYEDTDDFNDFNDNEPCEGCVSLTAEVRRLRERERVLVAIIRKAVPRLALYLRHLRAKNNLDALLLTNDLDDARAALEAVKE